MSAEEKKLLLTLYVARLCREGGGRVRVGDVYRYGMETLGLSRTAVHLHVERLIAAGVARRITMRELDCAALLQFLGLDALQTSSGGSAEKSI